jgi:hypothetical protein
VVALVAADAAALRRLPVAVVVKADVTEAPAATFAVEGAAAVAAGVGRLAAGVVVAIVVLVDGKATSGFPDKSIQKRLGSLCTARKARPRTLARYVIGRVFWMARRRGRSRFVSSLETTLMVLRTP